MRKVKPDTIESLISEIEAGLQQANIALRRLASISSDDQLRRYAEYDVPTLRHELTRYVNHLLHVPRSEDGFAE